ncbi:MULTISPECIES: hypothetical protein [Rhodococcus]|uniref:Uncharacterized protein n=1 Tax=Rhodococcus opacus RKJ300 = JCM 13270 TaxID=1165867 RepID=I0WS90_RHOOP|nr:MULTISPECIES: hypothetical protein [Rhodococcus]EID79256.1 hypothetical protein W59_14406 [Rhodococcus opacus RKJ300 = JCM 13270]
MKLPKGSLVRVHHDGHRDGEQLRQDRGQAGEQHRVDDDVAEPGFGEQSSVVVEAEDSAALVERAVDERLVEGRHDRGEDECGEDQQHGVLDDRFAADVAEFAVARASGLTRA